MKKGLIGGTVLGIGMIVAIIIALMCLTHVPTGYIGIVYSINKGVTGETVSQGWHFIAPTKKITKYSVGIEQAYMTKGEENGSKGNDSFNLATSDGKTVNCDIEFSYQYDVEKLPSTFTKFRGRNGDEIETSFIKPKIKAWAGEVTADYSVMDIMGSKRADINSTVQKYVADKFADYGINIVTVNFTRIDTDVETQRAIQKKVTAQQQLETAKIQSETALVEAQKEVDVAKKQAETKRIKAEAEAKANKEIAKSLTPELIQKLKIEKWNGELSKVSGSNSSIVIDK